LNKHPDLCIYAWPAIRLGEALQQLAQRTHLLTTAPVELPPPLANLDFTDTGALDQWLETLVTRIGVEVEPVQVGYADLPTFVQHAAPAILRLSGTSLSDLDLHQADPGSGAIDPARSAEKSPMFLILIKGGKQRVTLLTPNGRRRRVAIAAITAQLSQALVAPHLARLEPVLSAAGVAHDQQTRTAQAILVAQLAAQPIRGCWLIRLPVQAGVWHQVRQRQLWRPALGLVSGYLFHLALTLAAWWLIGRSALVGDFNEAWLWGWALLLFTTLPARALANSAQAHLSMGVGAWLKQRLLYGALVIDPEQMRHQGAGHFLGRVLDAETVENLSLTSGFWALLAVLQLGSAAVILGLGAAGWMHTVLLLFWFVALLALGWFYLRHQQLWSTTYRSMTNDLVERMLGHRTRLAQEAPPHWHSGEDAALAGYLRRSTVLDSMRTIATLLPRSWMVTALVVLFVTLSTPTTPAAVAISLGGMLLALQAFSSCVTGLQSLIGARVAWQQIAPLVQPTAPEAEPTAAIITEAGHASAAELGQPLLMARDLTFQYRPGENLVLRGCTLQIRQGDRLLLEGPSGGGKSTLASIVAGLRKPVGGLLLWRGFDPQTLGAVAWRRHIVAVPQFHENHVLTGTFAFNLLMGRRWPPTPTDLADAEALCRELGLGPLLDRMPAGLQQLIGESGWQLSHGERSRLYIARAILQQADLMILDESFAALDPESVQLAFACVRRHAPTLLVIAHP